MDNDFFHAALNFFQISLLVGTLSNLINFVVLSRPCIKSATNILLSILAFTDIFFMLLIYVFSKQYHDDVHHHTFEIYWRMFGLSNWFYSAFLYITIYLTLALTLDRYVTLSHPSKVKRRTIQAKNLASMILFACFLCSVSAAFEFQLVSEEYKNDELCNRNQMTENLTRTVSPLAEMQKTLVPENNQEISSANKDVVMTPDHLLMKSFEIDMFLEDVNFTDISFDLSKLTHKMNHYPNYNQFSNEVNETNKTSQGNHSICPTHYFLYPVESLLAKNKFYKYIFKSTATILLVLPVAAIALMFCALTVRNFNARKIYQIPVASSEIIEAKQTQTDILVRENKITLLVITLLVLFLICHTPNVVNSLYKSWLSIRGTLNNSKNSNLGFEIFCQVLMSINCCTKFFAYLLLYDEYWTSLKSMKTCFQCSTAPTEQIINTSKHLFPSTKADVENLLNYSLNKRRYSTQIPPEARHQFSISIESPRTHKASFSSKNSITPRLSLTLSDAEGIEISFQQKKQILLKPQVDRNSHYRSLNPLRLSPSPSSTNLARSKSLNVQSTVKHLPNCRLNKKF